MNRKRSQLMFRVPIIWQKPVMRPNFLKSVIMSLTKTVTIRHLFEGRQVRAGDEDDDFAAISSKLVLLTQTA